MGELKQVAETQAEISLVDRVKDLSNQVTLAGFGVVAKVEEVIAKVEEEGQPEHGSFSRDGQSTNSAAAPPAGHAA